MSWPLLLLNLGILGCCTGLLLFVTLPLRREDAPGRVDASRQQGEATTREPSLPRSHLQVDPNSEVRQLATALQNAVKLLQHAQSTYSW